MKRKQIYKGSIFSLTALLLAGCLNTYNDSRDEFYYDAASATPVAQEESVAVDVAVENDNPLSLTAGCPLCARHELPAVAYSYPDMEEGKPVDIQNIDEEVVEPVAEVEEVVEPVVEPVAEIEDVVEPVAEPATEVEKTAEEEPVVEPAPVCEKCQECPECPECQECKECLECPECQECKECPECPKVEKQIAFDVEEEADCEDGVKDWIAPEGTTLRALLLEWGEVAGWRVVWNMDRDYALEAGAVFRGRFIDVASALLRSFARAMPAPKGTFYKGNKVLVISTREDENAD